MNSMSTVPAAVNPTPVPTVPRPARANADAAETLRHLGIYTPESLDTLCAEEIKKEFVIDDLLAAGSVGILVGDSGIGKSPLSYQLALCVAAGVPFLGMRTSAGRVVYMDCENGALNARALRDSLSQFLHLPQPLENFYQHCDISDIHNLTSVVTAIKPTLVVIDTLRSFDATAEKDNTTAGTFIKALRKIGKHSNTAFLLIHHPKKQDGGFFGPPGIESVPVIQWLSVSCGARGLINQTDLRIGIEASTRSSASLVLRAHLRVRGEVGPWYLERILDDDQQPIGYERIAGVVELLANKDQETAYAKLGGSFSFKDARQEYQRGPQATTDFLTKCTHIGILRKVSKGRYEKVRRAEPE
jgi:AAA domain